MSAFRHHDEEFLRAVRDKIYDLSLAVFTALRPIRRTKAPLRLARDLVSSQRSPFRPETIDDVLTLCDTVRQAYNTPSARPWFLTKIPQPRAAPRRHLHPQTDSSASDASVGLNRQRRRDDPASGRGKAKRTMSALTTDSVSGSDDPHGIHDGYRHNGQAYPPFYHAPDPGDGTEPSFPLRIARNRVERRATPPRLRTSHTPALVPHVQQGSPPVNEDVSPLTTQLLIETITNATLAAVNQHLMGAGLLPRPIVDPQPTEPSLTRIAPHPSTLVQISAPALATNNVQYLKHDAPDTRDGGSPPLSNTASPTAFDRAFTAKMQAEYRTLDTRRVPQIQRLQFSPHTDRTAATQLLVHSMRDAFLRHFLYGRPIGLRDDEVTHLGFRLARATPQTQKGFNHCQPRRHAYTAPSHR